MSLSIDTGQRVSTRAQPLWHPRFATLAEWLKWQQQLHPSEIELGLERLRAVFDSMGLKRPAPLVITVAGTNGKGSSVAMLEAILSAAGYRVGSYTSPHLKRYNERIKICGQPVDDQVLCSAFAHIDWARNDISLTFFEFGTLAALRIFERCGLDVVILEVGLGGRLDAVNLIDADAVLITAIGIDHCEWLGNDREAIGMEKAGVLRPAQKAIVADPTPPLSIPRQAGIVGAQTHARGTDFGFRVGEDSWTWWSHSERICKLPKPGLRGQHQLDNASGVLALLRLGGLPLKVPEHAIIRGLGSVELAGRFSTIPGVVERIYDVAHNSDGVRSLAANLSATPRRGRSLGVVGMLRDKPAADMFAILVPHIDRWYLASLDGARGLSASELEAALRAAGASAPEGLYDSVTVAERAASQDAEPGDRIVCFGSFRTVAALMETAD